MKAWKKSCCLAELRFLCRTLQFADVGDRVAAHNVAASHIVRKRRVSARLVNLEELAADPIREVAKSRDGSMRAIRYSTEIIFEPIGVARNFNNS